MNPSNTADTLIVLYDGACQLCRREIAHVQGPVTLEIPNSRHRSEILSPIQISGYKLKLLIHLRTFAPRHSRSLLCPETVKYVSGITCKLCIGKHIWLLDTKLYETMPLDILRLLDIRSALPIHNVAIVRICDMASFSCLS